MGGGGWFADLIESVMNFMGVYAQTFINVNTSISRLLPDTYYESIRIELLLAKVKYGFEGSEYLKSYESRGALQLRRYKQYGEYYFKDFLPSSRVIATSDNSTIVEFDGTSNSSVSNSTNKNITF